MSEKVTTISLIQRAASRQRAQADYVHIQLEAEIYRPEHCRGLGLLLVPDKLDKPFYTSTARRSLDVLAWNYKLVAAEAEKIA